MKDIHGNLVKHVITEKHGGNNWESTIQAVCTCGWSSRIESCHNNNQLHDISAAIRQHKKEFKIL